MPIKTTSKNNSTAEKAKAALAEVADSDKEVKVEKAETKVEIPYRDLHSEGASPDYAEHQQYSKPLPKWQRMDPTFFPGANLALKDTLIWDRNIDKMRRVGLPEEYVYRFTSEDPSIYQRERTEGWRFCKYDGGMHSGLDVGGFQGTDLFEKTPDGRVRQGDTFLMFMHRRQAEANELEDKKMQEAQDAKPVNDFMNDAYKGGIRGFIEDDWGNPHYPDEKDGKKGHVRHIYN